jgi:leucyl/phenylalanyl-tRNA---protein transferase
MVLPVAKRLRKTLRLRPTRAEITSAFEPALTPRQGQKGTWIVPAMVHAYTQWHRAGRVHSVETWIDGELVGGLYCISIGRMVFGESMFAHRTDASKIALAALVAFCRTHGVEWIDCQQNTGHLASLGAREVPRVTFERHLSHALGGTDIADWSYHPAMWASLDGEADASGKTAE